MDISTINIENLENNSLSELREFAKEQLKLTSISSLRKPELLTLIKNELKNNNQTSKTVFTEKNQSFDLQKSANSNTDVPFDSSNDSPRPNERYQRNQNIFPTTDVQSRAAQQPAQDANFEPVKGIPADGILEIMSDGFGFLRAKNCYTSEKDVYISANFIKKVGLREGDHIIGLAQLLRANEKFPSLYNIDTLNGRRLDQCRRRPQFDNLVPIYPESRLHLETSDNSAPLSSRMIDLIAPIGKGQRGLIVSPPKAGKTTLLKQIANGISVNHPDTKLIILLVDERPEEVTDIQRSTNANVIFSTFDEHPEHHARVAELILEHGKRLVESGDDVVILLDSITRLARSYNLTVPASGRTLSGGLDPSALFSPKKFFGAARNIENGGSLTIIATALVETGSKMDDVIYEEFKGTGNMEIHLNRKLSERRIFPAIDIYKSGTRHDEKLLSKTEFAAIQALRRSISDSKSDKEISELVIGMLSKTKSNQEFVQKFVEMSEQLNDNVTSLDDETILNNSFHD